MYQCLYEYLVLNKQLNVPGIGTFSLEKRPAQTDFTQRIISPAAYSITMQPGTETPSKKFFNWLSDKLAIAYPEAVVRYNSFVYDVRDYILAGNKVVWNEVGTLSKGIAGDIRFEPAWQELQLDRPVSAVRVIREKAVHTVRVGEEEKTSEEMTELLYPAEGKKNYWWAPALIVTIILAIVLAIYFSQQGVDSSSIGNQQKITPQEPAATHKSIP